MKRILFTILIIISLTGDSYSQRIPFAFWNRLDPDTLELDAPTLIAPADDTTGVDQSPLLDWDGVLYATNYIVQLDNDTNFSPVSWTDTTVNSKATVELGLVQGTTWYWRVLAFNIFDTSEWSVTYSFTVTTGPALTTPVLTFPPDDTTNISQLPVLDWDTVINVRHYVVQLSDTTTFTTIHWSDSLTRSTATVDTTLDYSTTWYWRVIAYNDFDTSDWSDTNSFTVRDPNIAAPTLLTPANADTGQSQSPTLVWSGVDDADFYNVQLTQYSDFTSVLWNQNSFDTLKLVSMSLLNGTKWYWRVRSINATDTSAWSSSFAFIVTEGSSAPRAYYIDGTDGKDEYNGRTSTAPWQTISKVNARTLIPGDTIKFKGNNTYSDATLTISQSGTSTSVPIVFTSYGGSQATISASSGTNGIYAADVQYITIRNLKITSTFNPYSQGGATQNGKAGINLANNYNGQKSGIRIDSCYISRFNGLGIFIHSYSADSTVKGGYRDLIISNCTIDSIGHYGIYVTYAKAGTLWYGTGAYPNSNITVRRTNISRVTGIVNNAPYTGTGILFSDIDTSLVENCVIANCGTTAVGYGSGPGGFDAVRSNNITVQYCEVYGQQTGGYDGNGIHFDDGVTNSKIQYNYAHGNEGTGISVFSFSSGYPRSDSNNVIRYNILQGNGTGGSTYNGDITVRGSGRTTYLANVYNNTIYTTSAHTDTVSTGIVTQGNLTNTYIRNNVIVTGDSYSNLLDIVSGTYSNLLIQGNIYWNTAGSFKLKDGGTAYTSYNYWQAAKSRELISSTNVGYFLNPQLNNPGGGGTIGNTDELDTMTAYQTAGASPTKEFGLNIDSLFSINVGTVDYFGNALRKNYKFDIGAYENPDTYIWKDSTKLFIGKSTTLPTVARQYTYDSLYMILERDSLLRDTRALYIYAASDTLLALRNLKLDSITSIRNGTMTFSADSGFKGDGSSGVIKTQINPNTQNYGVFTARNCGLGIYILNNSYNTAPDISAVNGSPWFSLRVRGAAESVISGLNSSSELSLGSADSNSAKFYSNFRQTDSLITFANKTRRNYGSKFSDSTIVNYPINVGALANSSGTAFVSFSTHKYSAMWLGNNISTYRQGKLTEAIDWWMRRMNISVIVPYTTANVSPANNEDSVSITTTMTWDSIVNADSYHIQMSFQPTFTTLIGEMTGVTNARYIVGGVNPGAVGGVTLDTNFAVYWRVRGVNSIGNGNWSTTTLFTTHSTLQTETVSLISRFPNGVTSSDRVLLIDSFITALKADTIWTNLDVLYLFAAEDTGQANQNWISGSYTATRQGSTKPTLARDTGYTGNGSTGYINLNWAPSSGTTFTQNSACYGVFIQTNVGESGYPMGTGNAGTNFDRFNPRSATNTATYSINESVQPTVSNSDSRGLFSINRSGASATEIYRNSSVLSTNGGASTGRSTVNMLVCALNANGSIANFSTRQISMFFAGASMNAYRQAQLYKRIEWYLNRLGSFPFAPSAPTLISPVNAVDSTSLSPDFDWTDVGANYYQIEIDDDIAFGTPYYSGNTSGSEEAGENIGGLSNNTVYYWRVRGVNTIGTGSWSSTYSFTTTP